MKHLETNHKDMTVKRGIRLTESLVKDDNLKATRGRTKDFTEDYISKNLLHFKTEEDVLKYLKN